VPELQAAEDAPRDDRPAALARLENRDCARARRPIARLVGEVLSNQCAGSAASPDRRPLIINTHDAIEVCTDFREGPGRGGRTERLPPRRASCAAIDRLSPQLKPMKLNDLRGQRGQRGQLPSHSYATRNCTYTGAIAKKDSRACVCNGTYPRCPRTVIVFNGITCGDRGSYPRRNAGTDAAVATIRSAVNNSLYMLRSTTSRFGELDRVFDGGQSDLLNGIARLSILYEDLRLEMEELRILHDAAIVRGKPNMDYRVMYFLRRALATLVEFRGGLTTAIRTREFKDARDGLSSLDATSVFDAEKYLASNWGADQRVAKRVCRSCQDAEYRICAGTYLHSKRKSDVEQRSRTPDHGIGVRLCR
jgi:hypothetical protein